MGKVFFYFIDKQIRLSNSKRIKQFISEILQTEKIIFSRIDYIFCSDEYLLKLNKKFLHHDFYTDVISFPLNKVPLIGEIYISVDRVKDNSKKYNVSLNEEFLRIMFHGILHLCGYSDKTTKETKSMRFTENKYLRLFKEPQMKCLFHVKQIHKSNLI